MLGEIYALSTALLWSVSAFIFTDVIIKLGAIPLNIYRMIIASVLLAATILLFQIDYSLNVTQFWYLSLSGFIGLVVGDSFLFKSFSTIGPRVSILIMSCHPAIAAIIAYIVLSEILSLWAIAGMFITILGISLVVLEKQEQTKTKFKITSRGIFYAFVGAAGQAIQLIFAKMAFQQGEINGLTASFIRLVIAVALLYPIAFYLNKINNPIKSLIKNKKIFLLIIIGSIIGPFMGITLSFLAIIHTKIGIASTLMATMPIIMLPLSQLFYKEKLSYKAIIGAIIAVAGVAVLMLK